MPRRPRKILSICTSATLRACASAVLSLNIIVRIVAVVAKRDSFEEFAQKLFVYTLEVSHTRFGYKP